MQDIPGTSAAKWMDVSCAYVTLEYNNMSKATTVVGHFSDLMADDFSDILFKLAILVSHTQQMSPLEMGLISSSTVLLRLIFIKH